MNYLFFKRTLLILSLLFLNHLEAQEQAIKVFNEKTGKGLVIKEGKRIRIKTFEGEKISGRFKVIDDQSILVKNKRIKLSQIEKIKRNPLIATILTNGILYYIGTALIGASIIFYAFTEYTESAIFLIPATAFIYAGVKSPNILKGYKIKSNWKYSIVKIDN